MKSMKKLYISILVLLSVTAYSQDLRQSQVQKRVDSLLSKMTLEEKVGQMAQITIDVIGKGKDRYSSFEPLELDKLELEKAVVKYGIGSILNTANNRARTKEAWFTIISQIQEKAMKQTRTGIPVLYGIDAIHGTTYTAGATMFPQQIGQAASWNRALVRKGAEITAYETRASSIPWNFSPVLDLGADPRFPRHWETFGEDPYMVSEMGKQMIDGYEGENNNVSDPEKVASCLKHFLGYMVPVSGKDRTPAFIPEYALRDYHLPAFKAAIDAGTHSIMINSGIINGVPVHANYDILTKLLREELGFKGLAVTDWGDIENLFTRDKIARDHKEAIMIAVNAGIDMSMIAYNYEVFCDNLIALVKEGKVKQTRIDEAVGRILTLKFRLGLFERPVTNHKDYPRFGSKEFETAAYQAASESITLLKNQNNILPLTKTTRVFVTGPTANSMRTLNGGWTYSWQGEKVEEFASKYNTIVEALQNKLGKEKVSYIPGVSFKMDGKYYEEYPDKLDEAVKAAANSDVIILCLGENSYTETPGNMSDLYLSDLQTDFALKLAATGKPVILVLNEGRPRVISRIEPKMKGIIQTYLPGNFGADALADILTGDVNPSGKLPYTYPRYPNSLVVYNHKPAESRDQVEGVYNYDSDFNPQYQFGFGLSYTSFKYGNLQLGAKSMKRNEPFVITAEVTNTGKVEGKEVVQLFITDLFATLMSPDVKRLKGFEKITLKPGETKKLSFTITSDDLAYVNHKNERIAEPGRFRVQIGDQKIEFEFDTLLE
jgi:beta-glucosidase